MADIDPREFGKLEAQVDSLQAEVHSLAKDVKCLLELANRSKGGFWMGMTIASAVGGIATFFLEKVLMR